MNKKSFYFVLFIFSTIFLNGCVNTTTYSERMYGDNPITATDNKKNKSSKNNDKFQDYTPIY